MEDQKLVEPTPPDETEKALKKANDQIKAAWGAGLVTAGFTAVGILAITIFEIELMGISLWSFLDVAVILGISYGVYRKSRVCAVLLFAFFLLSKLAIFIQAGKMPNILFTIFMGVLFYHGIPGTLAYHRLIKQRPDLEAKLSDTRRTHGWR